MASMCIAPFYLPSSPLGTNVVKPGWFESNSLKHSINAISIFWVISYGGLAAWYGSLPSSLPYPLDPSLDMALLSSSQANCYISEVFGILEIYRMHFPNSEVHWPSTLRSISICISPSPLTLWDVLDQLYPSAPIVGPIGRSTCPLPVFTKSNWDVLEGGRHYEPLAPFLPTMNCLKMDQIGDVLNPGDMMRLVDFMFHLQEEVGSSRREVYAIAFPHRVPVATQCGAQTMAYLGFNIESLNYKLGSALRQPARQLSKKKQDDADRIRTDAPEGKGFRVLRVRPLRHDALSVFLAKTPVYLGGFIYGSWHHLLFLPWWGPQPGLVSTTPP
ncbi:hypothetical protein SODALDRAFT_361743 [Sodiomyces alkalinus F11]|uniref:Uncharacterized protein n=1 Tax=Sodiomyces alkalinus (strain CBS 110278 / VKM F-3762 / F11) TaxID=1314773 RepID=A0A3N2PQX4_SODAK|nr:hypothetical protein SODALDRAFT_361743 [Sodiomyces alkalinus F11]ROT36911.1 hypothetical protein SODALDRAFT_361743 [Sodiomyces alkalinus F11]